jgi:2-polyprenyl-6-methoxyphenol hydroxylase-like FAD-dependent oxidoreductase
MACVSTALIVGGGIAGLSAAIALARAGVQCEVVELAHAPLGASLGVSGRAAEALDELGVYDDCYATGTPFTRDTTALHIMDSQGRLISTGPQRPEWPGSKTPIGVYRPALLQILGDAALRLGATVRHGITVRNVEERDDACWVTLSDGEQRRCEFVVGADGIGSRTREMIFPDAPKPAYSGHEFALDGPRAGH